MDESGLSTRPHRVRTWAPRGQTPVLQETFNWKSLSLIAGITLWSFYFRIHAGSIKSEQVVGFLKALQGHLKGRKLLVILDGAPIHRARVVGEFVASTKGRLSVERLPAYAPELDPAEYLLAVATATLRAACGRRSRSARFWAQLKEHELGNLIVREAWQLSHQATAALRRMRRRPRIIRACFAQS